MAPSLCKLQLRFLSFLFFLLLVNGRFDLDPSDFKAFSIIANDLGIKGQFAASANPCSTAGVICEKRLSNNSYLLRITRLVFRSRRLTGFLSPAIGRLSELKELSVSNNFLVDQIPAQIVDCQKLEILDFRKNRFSGEVPSGLSSLLRLRVLDLSSNELSGNLGFLKYFPNLESLSVADNHFTGKIPSSVRSFRNLQVFNFSGNSFFTDSGTSMKAVVMRTTGYPGADIPKRYILAENSTTNKTRDSAAAPQSSAAAPSPTAVPHKHKNRKRNRKLIGSLLGFCAGALAGTVSGFIFAVLFKLILRAIRGGGKKPGPAIFSSGIKAEDLAFLEKDDGLAALVSIGKGGCGEVYKAELPGSNGKIIAIKKIIQPKEAQEATEEESKLIMNKKMRQIMSEINTVGQIRHRNLLSLLAHVSRPDCHYLVYEFMKNGSLHDILNEVSEGRRELDWLDRHRIALGVAAGLEYLHTNQNPRIIHRDLKPGNILLDDDMEARIADFGLAKIIPDALTHITTSNVAGTVGYIAPEYHQTLKFTDKCDIYSFGVVLAVLVMGKLPSDEFFRNTDEISLVKWMRKVMTSENPRIAIDPKLMGNGWEDQMLLVLKIACFCTLDDPKERPNSKDVRCMLSQIQH